MPASVAVSTNSAASDIIHFPSQSIDLVAIISEAGQTLEVLFVSHGGEWKLTTRLCGQQASEYSSALMYVDLPIDLV